jgi:hypothetical protein
MTSLSLFSQSFSWHQAATVYQGVTEPFMGVNQTASSPAVYVHTYNARYSAVWIAFIGSLEQLVYQVCVMMTEVHNDDVRVYWQWFIPSVVIVWEMILTTSVYPRMERIDSVHFILISGMLLVYRNSMIAWAWHGTGLIVSTMYLVSMMMEDCFLDEECYQEVYTDDVFVLRADSSISHYYALISYASHFLGILLVSVGWFIYLLVFGEQLWTLYSKKFKRNSTKLGI